MKKVFVVIAAVATLCRGTGAAEAAWLTDLPKAQAQAKSEHKIVLLDFTGSDWCPECKLLREHVFEMNEFQDYAAKNLVLVQVDFPDKKPQGKDLKKANEALKDKFKVVGFSTLVVLNEDGQEIGRPSGDESNPKAFIGEVEKLKVGK